MLKPFLIITFVACALAEAIETQEEALSPSSASFWGQIIAIIFLVMISGIVAGLTLSLMTLDTTNLAILQIAGTTQQQYYASRIIPIRKNGHLLLITMLLSNTVLNETLPILFDSIFSKGFLSVIVSTALLVLFSEIIPQALFTKHSLAIGAAFAFPVRILIGVWFIIAWPISKFLDLLLGKHAGFTYTAPEFSALIEIHDDSKHEHGTLKHETANLLKNILELQDQTVAQIMTPVNDMLLLPSDVILDSIAVSQYRNTGFKHIFVYAKHNEDDQVKDIRILGVLEIKTLINMDDKELKSPLGRMSLDLFTKVSSRTHSINLLDSFLHKHSRNQVALIYRTEEDIKFFIEERLKKENEIKAIHENALRKHTNGLKCRLYKIMGYQCHQCDTLSASASKNQDTIYNITEKYNGGIDQVSQSSLTATIDNDLEPCLLGMVTLSDLLNLLVYNKLEQQTKKSGILDFTAIHMKQLTL